MAEQPEAGPSTGPHRMRISSGGSIPNYVSFALSFLTDNPDRPLVLHTIPPEDVTPRADAPQPKSTLHSCTTTVPRLISVVEQIKRELIWPASVHNTAMKSSKKGKLSGKKRDKGKKPIKGIWQYTESGLLPAPERDAGDEDPLLRVLEGRTRPKMTHRPYLQITLSTKPLGLETQQNVTCQYILSKKRKAKGGTMDEEEEEEVEEVEELEQAEEVQEEGFTATVDQPGSKIYDENKGHKRKPSNSQEENLRKKRQKNAQVGQSKRGKA